MAKRLQITLISLLMSVCAIASDTSVKNADGVDIWYDFYKSTKKASVTCKGHIFSGKNSYHTRKIVIPSKVIYQGAEYSVTSIGSYAFRGCSSLTSIYVASNNKNYISTDGVIFNKHKTKLILYPAGKYDTTYTIPKSVTEIESYAFYNCSSLTSVTIPEGVTEIGEDAFKGCSSLTSVTIPEGVTEIGELAFYGCSGLTSVTIPEGVTEIGEWAFGNCSSLTSVTIPEGVTSIGEDAFYGCSGLTSVTIPESVTSIGDGAFAICSSLTSVTIPESITRIGRGAFRGCSSLTSVTIPEGVTEIGKLAFGDCSSLTSVKFNTKNSSLKNFFLFPLYQLLSPLFVNKKEDIESVTSIEYKAFKGCSNLTSITIPESVTELGDSVFCDCSRLTSVEFNAKNCTSMKNVFSNCNQLTSLTIGENVTSIPDYAFCDCNCLTSITIPESVTKIGTAAFAGCSGLTSITCKANNPPKANNAFGDDFDYSIPFFVTKESIEIYKNTKSWCSFTNIHPIPFNRNIMYYVGGVGILALIMILILRKKKQIKNQHHNIKLQK